MRIGSWNIAGGHKFFGNHSRALKEEYGEEDIEYFIKVLKKENPDIILLQEVHCFLNPLKSQQRDIIAKSLGLNATFPQAYCESHIEKGKNISLVTLSKHSFSNTYFHLLQNPKLTINRSNGQVWKSMDAGFLVTSIEYENEIINVLNGHLIPFHYFKRDQLDHEFKNIWKDIKNLFLQFKDLPTIIAGDFNYQDLERLFPEVFTYYKDAFKAETAPGKGQQDHILFSSHWSLKKTEILKTQSDHYLCLANVELIS